MDVSNINGDINKCITFLTLTKQPHGQVSDHDVKCIDMKLEAVSDMIADMRESLKPGSFEGER